MDLSFDDITPLAESDLISIGDDFNQFSNSNLYFKNLVTSSLYSLPKGVAINSTNMKEMLIDYIKSIPSLIWCPIPICILNLKITPDNLLPSHILLKPSTSNSPSTDVTDEEDIADFSYSIKKAKPIKDIALPKLLVVLDMDETLIHMHTNPQVHYDYTINLLEHSKTDQPTFTSCIIHPTMHISLRPGVRQFLDYLSANSDYFEVALFTAGTQSYADAVLEGLDPNASIIPSRNRYYRSSCDLATFNSYKLMKRAVEEDVQSISFLQKDLRKLDWPLARTILVDNCLLSFSAHPDNGVWIKSYMPGGTSDNEDVNSECLIKFTQVIDLLEKLKTVADVRPFLRNQFNLACLLGNFDINN